MLSLPYNAPPDEHDHFTVCRFIEEKRRLPVFPTDLPPYLLSAFTKGPITEDQIVALSKIPDGELPRYFYEIRFYPEIIDPYFSYLISVLFMILAKFFTQNIFAHLYAARAVSLICGIGVAILTFQTARKIFPHKPYLSLLSLVFVGFLPQFTFVSAYLNQDAFTALASALVFFAWFKCLEGRSNNHFILLGIALGLVILFFC